MQKIRDMVQEVIEESYLLGRTEEEIWADLTRFVELCNRVIREHVRNRKALDELASRLSLVKQDVLTNASGSHRREDLVRPDGRPKSYLELLAEKAARNKRLVLKAIEECDPRLVQLIQAQRFSKEVDAMPRKRPGWRVILLKFCYGLLVLCISVLLYLMVCDTYQAYSHSPKPAAKEAVSR